VGQTISFCRLSGGRNLPGNDRPRNAMVCPTWEDAGVALAAYPPTSTVNSPSTMAPPWAVRSPIRACGSSHSQHREGAQHDYVRGAHAHGHVGDARGGQAADQDGGRPRRQNRAAHVRHQHRHHGANVHIGEVARPAIPCGSSCSGAGASACQPQALACENVQTPGTPIACPTNSAACISAISCYPCFGS
jgi:hypothetical protein